MKAVATVLAMLVLAFGPCAASGQTPAGSEKAAVPSLAQVSELLTLMHTGDAQTPLMHAQLEKQRLALPTWFPSAVWDEVEHKVEAVHYADACLAVYQKYMTAEQVEIMSSIFRGSTGQEIATLMSSHTETAVKQGYRGYAADQQVGKTLQGDSTVPALMAKRFAEMPAEQRAKVQSELGAIQAVMPPVEDGCQAAYNAKATEVAHAVLAARSGEIAAAQRAYQTKH
jgi:hypothetical protein